MSATCWLTSCWHVNRTVWLTYFDDMVARHLSTCCQYAEMCWWHVIWEVLAMQHKSTFPIKHECCYHAFCVRWMPIKLNDWQSWCHHFKSNVTSTKHHSLLCRKLQDFGFWWLLLYECCNHAIFVDGCLKNLIIDKVEVITLKAV